jgi:hypothetical protein
MTVDNQKIAHPTGSGGFLSGEPKQQEKRSFAPFIIAGVVVLLIVAGLLILSGRRSKGTLVADNGTPDAYARQLAVSDIALSQSSNIAGSQITYVDGVITNHGDRVVDGISVTAAFHLNGGSTPQVVPTLLNLIRAREPYIDIQSVSADPLKPGESKPFRLIFDHVDPDWDQKNPDLAIIHVHFS